MGTRVTSGGACEAKQLAQHQTQVESRDVYQLPLRDVVSSSEADTLVPARFKDVGKAPFDQLSSFALQRFARRLLVISRHKQAEAEHIDQTLALLHRIVCMLTKMATGT